MSKWDPNRGKASRKRLVQSILKQYKGRIPRVELHEILTKQGYPHLIGLVEAMGFTVGDDGYVYGAD